MADTTDIPQPDYSAYSELSDLPVWLAFALVPKKSGEGFDKIPNNGLGNVSTKAKSWLPLDKALAIKERERLPGVCLNMTGGIHQGDHTLVGLDFDEVNFARFKLPFKTYMEKSPSGKGIRAFAWVPTEWAQRFMDTPKARPSDCDHCEVYRGTGARHLTVTGDRINAEPIAKLGDKALAAMESWGLKPYEEPTPASATQAVPCDGTPVVWSLYDLNPSQRELVNGKTEKGERHKVLHGLLIKLLNAGCSKADTKASMLKNPAILEYLGKHADPATFADEEIEKAYKKSFRYQRERLNGYSPDWTPEATSAPVEAEAEAQQRSADNRARLRAQLLGTPVVSTAEAVTSTGDSLRLVVTNASEPYAAYCAWYMENARFVNPAYAMASADLFFQACAGRNIQSPRETLKKTSRIW